MIVRLNAPTNVLEERNAKRHNPPNLALNHIRSNSFIDAELELDTGSISVESAAHMVAEKLADKAAYRTL